MRTRKFIYVEVSLTPETPLTLFYPVDQQSAEFYSLDRKHIIHEPLRVAGLNFIPQYIPLWNGHQGCIVFVVYMQMMQKRIACKPQPVLQKDIVDIFVDDTMLQSQLF